MSALLSCSFDIFLFSPCNFFVRQLPLAHPLVDEETKAQNLAKDHTQNRTPTISLPGLHSAIHSSPLYRRSSERKSSFDITNQNNHIVSKFKIFNTLNTISQTFFLESFLSLELLESQILCYNYWKVKFPDVYDYVPDFCGWRFSS